MGSLRVLENREFFLYWVAAYLFWLPIFASVKLGFLTNEQLGYFVIEALSLLYIVFLTAISMFILRLKGRDYSSLGEYLGLTLKNFGDGLIYGGLATLPLFVLLLAILFLIVSGNIDLVDSFFLGSLPLIIIRDFNGGFIPLAAFFHWTLNGFISFSLLMAIPYRLASEHMEQGKAYIATFVPWCGFYNGLFYKIVFGLPLGVSIMGELIDIVVLGGLFLIAFIITGNSLGLILAYIFIYEAPVKACVYYGWGLFGLAFMLLIGLIWQILSVVIYFRRKFIGGGFSNGDV
ncbi:MAG: hypothetical protein ACP6IP_03715 [Candidatus Njordarchaeia archaeon]